MVSRNLNEYDVALFWILETLATLQNITNENTIDFVKIECGLIERLQPYASSPSEEYMENINDLKNKFGLVKANKKQQKDVVDKSIQEQSEERTQKQYKPATKKTISNKKPETKSRPKTKPSVPEDSEENFFKKLIASEPGSS